ncbi:Mitotic spindle assembly checkpoint protein MAD1, partial [Varanus komodoensis]
MRWLDGVTEAVGVSLSGLRGMVEGGKAWRSVVYGVVMELKKQVESAELKNQRLKEVFRTKIQEFRKVCYKLTGYQIDMTTENQYRLTSVYAEHREDCLIFK